jgi:hypothetical protein
MKKRLEKLNKLKFVRNKIDAADAKAIVKCFEELNKFNTCIFR